MTRKEKNEETPTFLETNYKMQTFHKEKLSLGEKRHKVSLY